MEDGRATLFGFAEQGYAVVRRGPGVGGSGKGSSTKHRTVSRVTDWHAEGESGFEQRIVVR